MMWKSNIDDHIKASCSAQLETNRKRMFSHVEDNGVASGGRFFHQPVLQQLLIYNFSAI